jgi:hypothetical protein
MEVNGQFHAPSTLPWVNKHSTHWIEVEVCVRTELIIMRGRKISFPCQESNSRFLRRPRLDEYNGLNARSRSLLEKLAVATQSRDSDRSVHHDVRKFSLLDPVLSQSEARCLNPDILHWYIIHILYFGCHGSVNLAYSNKELTLIR